MRHAATLALGCLLLSIAAAATADTREVLEAYRRGQYEKVISLASEAIEADEKAPEGYYYLRGMAAYQIAWFGQALDDLEPLAEYNEGAEWPAASKVCERVRRSRELAPANVRELRDGGAVSFRVYYDVDDKWTRSLLAALGGARRTVCDFFGVRIGETAVFVFADKERHVAFTEALWGKTESWAWASGGNGLLVFCPYAPGNNYRESPDQLPETAAHEYCHCLTARVLGRAQMPMWLAEGLAMYCGGLVRPRDVEDNDLELTRMWTADRILPLRVVTGRDTFYDEGIAAYAYTQGYAMARFLVSRLGRPGLLSLLNSLKDSGKFETAMREAWDGGVEGFYEDWLAATEQRVQKFR